jgi:hypothetical protein
MLKLSVENKRLEGEHIFMNRVGGFEKATEEI